MAAYARCSRDSMQVGTASISVEDHYLLASPENMAQGQLVVPQVKYQSQKETNGGNTRRSKKTRRYRKLDESDFAPDLTIEWSEQTFRFPEEVATRPTQNPATDSSLHHERKPRPQRTPVKSPSHNNGALRPPHPQTSPKTPQSQPKNGRRRDNRDKMMDATKVATTYSVPPHLRGTVSSSQVPSELNITQLAHTTRDDSNAAQNNEEISTPNQHVRATSGYSIPPHLRDKAPYKPTSNISRIQSARTKSGTSNAVQSRGNSVTSDQHKDLSTATIMIDPAVVAFRPKLTELATVHAGFTEHGFSTPHQQTSPSKAPSSSGPPPTGSTNGHRSRSLQSPPSSPIFGENEEQNSGTIDNWRCRWKGSTHQPFKRISLDTSNGEQAKAMQQSKWNLVAKERGQGQKKVASPEPIASEPVGQNQDDMGLGWNEPSSCQFAPNASHQPPQSNNGKEVSINTSPDPLSCSIAQQRIPNKKSRNPNYTWDDPWDPKQADKLKGPNGWPKKGKPYWPKNSEMKAQPVEDEGDDGLSSNSNSNGDPLYDVKKLIDWSGNWMPPPEVWTGRNTFRDRHFGESMEVWMKRCEACGTSKLVMDINPADFLADHGRDLVPRDWIPSQLEGDSPQEFWRSLSSRAPAPVDDGDMDEAKPWWELYANPTTEYLSFVNVPDACIDPEHADNQKRVMPPTSKAAVDRVKENQEAEYRKTMARRNRPTVIRTSMIVPATPDLSLKPTANIYLRPAQPADIPEITKLYNQYVRETINANEFNNRTPAHMAARLQDINIGGLPWIVAVKRGNHSKNQHYKFINEEIVGFANMDDYCDQGSIYRYTMEMEMYVHPEYLRQGIGKCLLDRMLELVDNGYRSRGGYEWICNGAYLKSGATRVIKTVNVHFLHEHGVTSEASWVAAFLKSFSFRKCGHLYNMGYKLGKTVDVTIFQYSTSEHIDAQARPHAPL